MKTLIIIRHGKSDSNAPPGDHGRPLTDHGKRDAAIVATQALPHLPGNFLIWSSPAKRALMTATIFSETFAYPVEDIIVSETLYTFDARTLEKEIKACDNLHNCLLVFGHNEAITDFVNKFGDIFIDSVPTSGLVSLNFDTSAWRDIAKGKTTKVIFPRDFQP